ncbi:hypothetical protein EDD86DRAFT_199181 [Gorgonomyces haynaldii]|nr:hypothetical protein EDD86DRAFT_199181 [Gorgonomyces haynaldii]
MDSPTSKLANAMRDNFEYIKHQKETIKRLEDEVEEKNRTIGELIGYKQFAEQAEEKLKELSLKLVQVQTKNSEYKARLEASGIHEQVDALTLQAHLKTIERLSKERIYLFSKLQLQRSDKIENEQRSPELVSSDIQLVSIAENKSVTRVHQEQPVVDSPLHRLNKKSHVNNDTPLQETSKQHTFRSVTPVDHNSKQIHRKDTHLLYKTKQADIQRETPLNHHRRELVQTDPPINKRRMDKENTRAETPLQLQHHHEPGRQCMACEEYNEYMKKLKKPRTPERPVKRLFKQKTPPGYWDLGFPSDEELAQRRKMRQQQLDAR